MFDLGWPELLLIGIVALIVMGDDFPTMFRTLGRFTGKMRKMAREFSRAMEEAADESGVKDVSNSLKAAASPKSMGLDALNKAAGNYEKWEAGTKRKKPGSGDEAKAPAAETPKTAEKAAEKTAEKTAGKAAGKAPEEPAASKRPAPPAAPAATADDTAAAPDPEPHKATDTGT